MTNDELIGKVAACYLRDRLSHDDSPGVARYIIDCLTADQTASIARTVLADVSLSGLIEIKLPIRFVGRHGLPPAVLTEERTTFFRNAACAKSALLLANTGDDEEQSLKELVQIGASQLQETPDLWIGLVSEGLPITDQHKHWWTKALQGLLDVRSFALDRLAEYLLKTRKAVEDGDPILSAMGAALPALRVPRDTGFFRTLNEKTAGHSSKWKALYSQAIKRRACYLLKQTPSQTLLLEEDLESAFKNVRGSIPDNIHPTINAFIAAGSGWNAQAAELAQFEWESVKPLFDGLKREQFNIGKATTEFYEERDPALLNEEDRDYLTRLCDGRGRGASDEDNEFYRQHRGELKEQPSLKTKWDRFVYGTPVEVDDFLVGLTLSLQQLFDIDLPPSKRRLRITCDRHTKRELKELNEDAGLYFAHRYSGLKALFGNKVSWDVGDLMNFAELSALWRAASRRYVNTSLAKAALQLKFTVELEYETSDGSIENRFKQIIWKFDPSGVASELPMDWNRLQQQPLRSCRVSREPVSNKGHYQSLDLRNIRTLYPAYGQDRGSLVANYSKQQDISKIWPDNLAAARSQGLISEPSAAKILRLFQTFQQSYQQAISGFARDGLACGMLLKQAADYGQLLQVISGEAKGDRNRDSLMRPLLEIGTVAVDGGRATAIIAPWHPLRLEAMAVKAMQIAALLRHLLTTEEVCFGDAPLFFKELKSELSHPYYPELALGWRERKPELLSMTDHDLDYSLHEAPVISNDGFDDTNENPSETSELLLNLTKRYLALYPHERANLSVVLYNGCSSKTRWFAVQ